MRCLRTDFFFKAMLICLSASAYSQEAVPPLYMDFRNQNIADIIYSVAEICGESVLIDETVTGTVTFRFEDKDFESALQRFAKQCQLYVEKDDGVYVISKVRIENHADGKLAVNTENVQVEPFLNMLSRYTNRTILFDSIPNAAVTIRAQEASLEDVLNLAIVKLPGFALERIADGYYITKSSGNLAKRNIDVFTVSEVGGRFSVNIQRAAFANVIDTLFKKGKKEYALLFRPNIQLEDMAYSGKEFDELLSLVLCQGGCDYTVSGGIYYIYEIQKKDIVKRFKETRIMQIRNMGIESLLALLPNELNASGFIKADKNSNSVILTGSSAEISPIEEFIQKVDVPVHGRVFRRFSLENIRASDAVSVIPKELLMSDIILLPSENGFVTQVTEESESRLFEFIRILDGKKQNRIVKLKYIKSSDLMNALPPSAGKDSITETNEPTLVFFTGTEAQFAEFSRDLQFLDRPRQQIKYQLLVLQRQKTDGMNWGTSVTAGDTDGDSGYTWSGMLSHIFSIQFDIISKFGIQFAGSLNAELSQGKSRVLADTTLSGISGESLRFSNTNTYRYRDIIVDTSGDLYTSTTREITSGLTLSISGWVSGDGMVTVTVDAQVSKQGSTDSSSSSSQGADTSVPPSTSEKKVSTHVRTKSGEPVAISGLFQQEEDISEKRVPGIGAVPLLGRLFKSRNATAAESEFVIYLVPFVQKEKERELTEEENLVRLMEKYGES